MAIRWPAVIWPSAVFAALGFLIGVEDWRLCASFALRRLDGWGADLPVPRGMLWVAHLRGGLQWILASKFSIPIAVVMLSVLGIWALARLMDPNFQLTEPAEPSEDPEERPPTNIDVPRLVRLLAASVITLWLMGAFVGAASLWKGTPTEGGALSFFWPLPHGLDRLPPLLSVPLHGVILGAALWLVWSPNGPFGKRSRLVFRDISWGVLAGLAAAPALLVLYHARYLAQGLRQVVSLTDGRGWSELLTWVLLTPVFAGLWLGLVAYACRPRPFTHQFMSWFGALAAVAVLAGSLGAVRVHQEERAADFTGLTLASTLKLQPAAGRRKALIITPSGLPLLSAPEDGSNDQNGDRIVCTPESVERVQHFLQERKYESYQAFRAYVHLFDCAALEWQPDRAMGYSLETLERAPTPVAAQVLKEQLAECAVTPESRRVLDALADPKRFRWPEPLGRRWLGLAYMRFGDPERGRSYLLRSGLDRQQLRRLVGGIEPLSDGTITGRIQVNGQDAQVRVGIVRAETGFGMPGPCAPFEWRHVAASTETDSEGRFRLTGVAQGNYLLMISGTPIQEHRSLPKVKGARGITLDRFKPSIDLGSVDLQFPDPTPAPQPHAGGLQTARAGSPAEAGPDQSSRT